MIHAQGLEGLDGIVCTEFDKCFYNVKAPVLALLDLRKQSRGWEDLNLLMEEDIVCRRFTCISTSNLLSLCLVMFEESLHDNWSLTMTGKVSALFVVETWLTWSNVHSS